MKVNVWVQQKNNNNASNRAKYSRFKVSISDVELMHSNLILSPTYFICLNIYGYPLKDNKSKELSYFRLLYYLRFKINSKFNY